MHILVIGAGAIGFQLSKQLSQDGHDITQIDTDPSRVKRVSEQLDIIVAEGNGTSLQDLRGIGIEQVDLVAAMTTNDEVNLLACRMAKKLGVQSAIARVRNPEFTAPDFIFSPQELGVDQFIHPEKETADAIVRLIRQSSATDLVEFAEGKLVLLGMRLDHQSSLLHAPLTELGRQLADIPMRIVAIQRKQQTLIPRGNTTLLPEDRIFVISDPDFIPAVTSLTGLADHRINDIAILGGGLIGQFVAQELSSQMRVRLIESRADRSRQIADQLAKVLVIQGDGTDYDLLAVEGLADMDAFIAVTGNDEVNIISTLVAKHLEVPRAIALVNNVDYMPITPAIGLDSVLSKQLLTVKRRPALRAAPAHRLHRQPPRPRRGSGRVHRPRRQQNHQKTPDLHPPAQGFDHRRGRAWRSRGHSAGRHAHPPRRQSRGLRPALCSRGSEKDLRGVKRMHPRGDIFG